MKIMLSFSVRLYLVLWTVSISLHGSISTSIAHTIFTDPAQDPFYDAYIETIIRMNTKDILAIPKMDDDQFLAYLENDIDEVPGVQLRADPSIFDAIRDDQLIEQRNIDREWETLMVSGPIVVNYIGNLMALSSKRDFPFNAPVGYVYRYIRYPNSFRATLAQVSSEMYNALMNAHTAMDRIQLAIQQVPTHIKTALKLITSAGNAMLKSMLPRTLDSVSRLATESAQVANTTLHQFVMLQELLAEIIELSASTQSNSEANIQDMHTQMNQTILDQERLQQSLNTIQTQFSNSKAALEEARKKYNEAMTAVANAGPAVVIPGAPSRENMISDALMTVSPVIGVITCIFGMCDPPRPIIDNSKFENAMKLAEKLQGDLERAEALYNEHFQLMLAEQNELAKTMADMAMLDLSILDTEEIVQLLLEATKKINEIKEQWSRMIQFFSKIAIQAHSTQQVVVKDFVEVIEQAQQDNLLVDPLDREFFVDLLIPAATQIDRGSHLLFTMAQTYYAISSEHMITQIAGIGKLLLLQTDNERTDHLKKASNETITTSMKITQLAESRRALYLETIHKRQEEYHEYAENLAALELDSLIG